MIQHKCYCGVLYACPWCGTPDGYICPTVNSDEDANMCSDCLAKWEDEYTKWYMEQQDEATDN
jgi:hypothetical protein